jgi:hypothetical protein
LKKKATTLLLPSQELLNEIIVGIFYGRRF